MVFVMFDIHWVTSRTIVDLLACWQGKFRHNCNGYLEVWASS